MTRSIPLDLAWDPPQGKQSSIGPRLLVSIRDAQEARLAWVSGVNWIDLKNPDGGSLGAAEEATAIAVAKQLSCLAESADSANGVISAAVGELRDCPQVAARMLARYFPLLKVGLSGMRDRESWAERVVDFHWELQELGATLVPVIYADYDQCLAPTPIQVIEAAERLRLGQAVDAHAAAETAPMTQYLLIDTYTKDGRRLLDFVGIEEIESIIAAASEVGRQVVLAGSLAWGDLPLLMDLPVAAIAVRGAVCEGDRRSRVCPQKLQQWVELFASR